MKLEKIIQFIEDTRAKNYVLRFSDNHLENIRLFVYQGKLCKLLPKSRKYGTYIDLPYDDIISIDIQKKDNLKTLRNNIKNGMKYLERSKMWDNFYETFVYLNSKTDDELRNYIENGIDDLLKDDKFHFGFDMFYGLVEKPMRTINYDKYSREFEKECTRKAIQERKEHYLKWEKGYDNTIHVKLGEDGILRGWYSEEYRGCGNGHYYLMLDEMHVIFCEND